MEFFITDHGYLSLFLLSFLASTILPLGSEWLLVTMLLDGQNPGMSVAVATIGNTLGACTTYAIGLYGGTFLTTKVLRISDREKLRAEKIYRFGGSWTLLLSWLPVIGDPLCLVGGLFNIRFGQFLLLVCCGKFARYAAVSLLTLETMAK